jgi:hypothetical protein
MLGLMCLHRRVRWWLVVLLVVEMGAMEGLIGYAFIRCGWKVGSIGVAGMMTRGHQ